MCESFRLFVALHETIKYLALHSLLKWYHVMNFPKDFDLCPCKTVKKKVNLFWVACPPHPSLFFYHLSNLLKPSHGEVSPSISWVSF